MEQLCMFEDKKEKSTDWKWSFKDYPEKNGLKVFSCFSCGGGQRWATNFVVAKFWVSTNLTLE